MAANRIRRWFQFGVLDVMILTAVVAAVVSLLQPAEAKANKASPWVIGGWYSHDVGHLGGAHLKLYPDGYYRYLNGQFGASEQGFRWTVTPLGGNQGAFLLVFGNRRFVIRSEWGSRTIEALNKDGGVESRLEQSLQFEGPWRDGAPHGIWKIVDLLSPRDQAADSLEYRQGVPIDGYDKLGRPTLVLVNAMRRARGLPEM